MYRGRGFPALVGRGSLVGYAPTMLLVLLACAPTIQTSAPGRTRDENSAGTHPTDSGDSTETGTTDNTFCEDDVVECITQFPFHAQADTREGESRFEKYSCDTSINEGGPELVWRVDVPEDGFLSAALLDDADAGVDIDLHLLASLDASDCIDRGNFHVGASVKPGSYFLVADTFVSGGDALSGEFSLDVGFLAPTVGDCSVETGTIRRVGDNGEALAMPATGPVVLEAHLVAVDDGYGTESTDPWPTHSREGLDDHYQRADSTLTMHREQNWAPQENCEYGQGASGDKLPREDEGWYVNMYWSNRPEGGTRMILRGQDGRAVVASAGWETGPGDLEHVAGTTEEAHFYLGTGHLDRLTLGFASDQNLPLGPIVCE